jgi:hypothetical protein
MEEFPTAPPVTGEMLSVVARPLTVDRSVRLWWFAAGCWLVDQVLGALLHSQIAVSFYTTTSSTVSQDPTTGDTITQTHTTPASAPVAIIASLVIAALWAGLILLLRRGANWARITLTVLAVIGELGLLVQVVNAFGGAAAANTGTIVQTVLGLVLLGLVLGALITMYRSDARPYFRRRR